MAPPWLFVLLSAALCVHSRPQDPNAPAEAAAGSDALAPIMNLKSSEPSQAPPGKAWGMGSLTVPMAVRRSWIGSRLFPDKRQAGNAGADPNNTDNAAGALVLVIERRETPKLVKRTGGAEALDERLQPRSDIAYYTTLKFGNPPQAIRVLVDTGSSELWINADCSTSGSSAEQAFCTSKVGRYNSNSSNTASSSGEKSGIRYGSGSVNFTYFIDDVALANLPNSPAMKGVKFGVATSSRMMSSGILGIAAGKGVSTKYKNFIDQLADQGLTRSKSYSIGLGLKGEKQGSIIFGGIDSSKFVGKLKPQPIIPPAKSPDKVPRFWVRLDSISHTAPGRASGSRLGNSTMPVILDTGSTLALLPTSLVEEMASALSAGPADQTGLRQVPCQMAERAGSFDFAFDGVTIRVPYKEVIRQQQVQSNAGIASQCYLGVMESDSLALLGDTFLRSAYAVFDIDGNNVLLAQYANCGDTPRTAQSSEFANMSGQCGQRDLAPNTRLAESGENAQTETKAEGGSNGQSAAAGRLAANTKGLAAAVGAALVLTLGL
ncbi:eukaryotic aspartyl protease [Hirsutella rhossiliensis]|uniref:Eukaryotic aspartyl protease domain-containing protein n=1 Tax=Hirsutella rhossiliensis TaxID=111463 RepID=A0A9P8SKI4_9HYPO|nr:eukaryotic aspartyl protease domain-containing protein [Hirsutella rhossiliensis]KAH0965269.1 eukaryotic aspartyl protease domain-containing protein [Hirsutella rhossiliensis]